MEKFKVYYVKFNTSSGGSSVKEVVGKKELISLIKDGMVSLRKVTKIRNPGK